MKFHHAAALALVGWCLMMPSPYWSKTNPRTAPLRQWTLFGRYDNAHECFDERSRMMACVEHFNGSKMRGRAVDTNQSCVRTTTASSARCQC